MPAGHEMMKTVFQTVSTYLAVSFSTFPSSGLSQTFSSTPPWGEVDETAAVTSDIT